MTTLGGVTVLFLSLLYMVCSLSILFMVMIAYCVLLEWAGLDPDSTPAFIFGVFGIVIPGLFLSGYLFVTEYVPFMDHVLLSAGLTRG